MKNPSLPFLLVAILAAFLSKSANADPAPATLTAFNGAASATITGGTTITLGRLGTISTYSVALATGTSPYTANLVLSDTGFHPGDIYFIPVSYPASTNPILQVFDSGTAGTLLHSSTGTAIAGSTVLRFVNITGTNWTYCPEGALLSRNLGSGVQSALSVTPNSSSGIITGSALASATAAAANPFSPALAPAKTIILFAGDSLLTGHGLASPSTQSVPAVFSALPYAANRLQVVDYSVDGNTIQNLAAQYSGSFAAFAPATTGTAVIFAFTDLGNDYSSLISWGFPAYTGTYNAFIATMHSAGFKVMAFTQYAQSGLGRTADDSYRLQFNQWLLSGSSGADYVCDTADIMNNPTNGLYYLSDGLHPTALACILIAARVQQTLIDGGRSGPFVLESGSAIYMTSNESGGDVLHVRNTNSTYQSSIRFDDSLLAGFASTGWSNSNFSGPGGFAPDSWFLYTNGTAGNYGVRILANADTGLVSIPGNIAIGGTLNFSNSVKPLWIYSGTNGGTLDNMGFYPATGYSLELGSAAESGASVVLGLWNSGGTAFTPYLKTTSSAVSVQNGAIFSGNGSGLTSLTAQTLSSTSGSTTAILTDGAAGSWSETITSGAFPLTLTYSGTAAKLLTLNGGTILTTSTYASVTAQTSTTTLLTFTPPATAIYTLHFHCYISANPGGTQQLLPMVSFTDESGSAASLNGSAPDQMNWYDLTQNVTEAATAIGQDAWEAIDIRPQGGHPVVIATGTSGSGSITYNADAWIEGPAHP